MVAKFLDDNKPKTSLIKRIRTVSNFDDFIQFHLICQMMAKFSGHKIEDPLLSGVKSERTVSKKLNVIIELTLIRLRLPINLISILSMWVKTWPKELKIVMEVRPNS